MQLALSLLLVVTISRINQHFPLLLTLRVPLLLTLAVAAFAWMNPQLIRRDNVFTTWPAKVMVGLGVMSAISTPFGISFGGAASMVLDSYSKVLIGAFLIVLATRSVRDLYTLVVAFVAGNAILAFLCLWVFPVSAAGGLMRIAFGYGFDANDLGVMAVCGMAVSLCLVATGKGWFRLLGLATIAGLVGSIARSGSRGGFLGLMALGLGFLLLVHGIALWKRIALVAATASGLALVAPPGYWTQMKTMLSPKEDYNWVEPSGRRQLWKRGMQYMVDRPLTGIGIGNFARAEGTISELAQDYEPGMAGIRWSAAHNSFVQVGAEMGFPGLILFSWLVLGGIVTMQHVRTRMPRHWSEGTDEQRFLRELPSYLSLAMLAFAVAGFFVSFAYWDLVYILAAFMSAVYFCYRKLDPLHASGVPSLARSR